MESDNCVSSPIIVLKDCNVLGRAAPSGSPNENRSHSTPNRSTPSLMRGVSTRRISDSISSKSLRCFPPRSTSPSPTYVASAVYSPDKGQNEVLGSSARADEAKKSDAQPSRKSDRGTNVFTCSSTSAVPAKQGNCLGNVFHHH